MPFTLDNIVQSSTGSFDSTSGTADLGAVGTEAGNAVVLLVGLEGDNSTLFTVATPAGFTHIFGMVASASQGRVHTFLRAATGAGEGVAGSTPWALSVTGGSTQCAWAAFEISGVDSSTDWGSSLVYVQTPSGAGGSTVTSKLLDSVGTISYTYNGIALAPFFAANTTPTTPAISGFTDGFTEYVTQTVADGTRAHRLTVAARNVQAIGEVVCTATISPASYVSGGMLVFTGVESHHATDLLTCFGAEIGTAANVTASTLLDAVVAPFDEVVGTPTVVTTNPRSGSYCLEISSTAAAESVAWTQRASPASGSLGSSPGVNPPTVWVDRLHVYFPTLPSVDVDLSTLEAGSAANGVQLWYRTATQKLGVKIGTGTEVASAAAVAAGQWIGVDRFYDPRTTTHTCDWAVDYDATPGDTTVAVPQTQASTSGMTAAGVSRARYGHTGTLSATYRFDDIVASKQRKGYPLADVRVLPLKVDPAGTPAVVGTAGNFRTFTGNGGTLSAWTAADTRTRLSNIPPVVGASASGLAQVTAAASDYVEVPMETFTCAPDYAPIGGRWYWAGWAASGTTAQFGSRFTDSSRSPLTLGLVNPTDAEFDNSTLRWVTVIHRNNINSPYLFTQAVVDSLLAHFGLSNDATPDAGVLGVVFELVVQTARVESMFGSLVAAGVDPATGGIVRIDVDAPVGATSTSLYYEETGTPTTVPVTGGTSHTETIGAPDATVVNYIAVATPAEPAPTD